MDYYRHDSADVHSDACIGAGTHIWQFCCIMQGVQIGQGCNIGAYVFVETGVKIGNGVKVKNNVSLYKGVELEDDVFVGPNVVFTNVINPRSFISRKSEFRPTIVKKGASIGANATVVCGHTIGEYALIGAGTVVTKDVPSHALVMGNPGRVTGYVCECGEKLQKREDRYVCDICQKHFIL
ncbi:MAG: N-acetyltransferase [Lachnoclostridium sp.]|nr:N-acetyltransferase [Lachnospira sp.]MCM1246992.1 N-acetyltransferase [Lachnoclostridium sp.]MCM1535045.1 N-acetyltransferase [Clostridium sp.]